MRSCKSSRIFCVVLWVVVLSGGCSSSDSGGGDSISGVEIFTTPGSDLVLRIPNSLNVRQEDIVDIHAAAENVSHCYTTSREPVDIVLAEACAAYDFYYLYPQYFPQNLDSIFTIESYVLFLQANDPFTFYMPPDEYVSTMANLDGERAFIGFSVELDGETVSEQTPLLIADIVPFTRAWIDGLKTGDSIVRIDGVPIEGMSLEAAALLFPTHEEEAVDITADRNGVEVTIATAAEENIGLLLYQDIAYLSVRTFTEKTGEDVRLDFEKLRTEARGAVDKLILDLRGNGGGLVSGMLALADYLVDNDIGTYPIAIARGPAYDEETRYLGDYNELNIGNFDKTNFVLLIDENSASASETVASVLKYYGTATLIGETTFGKGIGQSIIELIDGSGVFVPSFESLPPSGESYHHIGIPPDYYLDAAVSDFDDDPVLDGAVEYLNTGGVTVSVLGKIPRKHSVAFAAKDVDPLREALLKRSRSGRYH